MTDTGGLPGATAVESRVLGFLHGELLEPGVAVNRETDLLSGVVLDSVSVLRLAAFVSEAFQLDLQPADFIVEHFRTVDAIATYVRRRLAERADQST
jgi:acyl carrier protein